jgi:Sec-independent protein translocase protein TatA
MIAIIVVGAVLVVGAVHMPKPIKKVGHGIVHVFKHGLMHINESDAPAPKAASNEVKP